MRATTAMSDSHPLSADLHVLRIYSPLFSPVRPRRENQIKAPVIRKMVVYWMKVLSGADTGGYRFAYKYLWEFVIRCGEDYSGFKSFRLFKFHRGIGDDDNDIAYLSLACSRTVKADGT